MGHQIKRLHNSDVDSSVISLAFDPNEEILIAGYYRDSFLVKFWELEFGQDFQTVDGYSDEVIEVAFNPAGNILVCAGGGRYGGSIELWELKAQ